MEATELSTTTVEQTQETTVNIENTTIETDETTAKENANNTEDGTGAISNSLQFTLDDDYTWVINTSTNKFHYPWCSSVDQMNDENKQISHESASELIEEGYSPCQRCDPED